MIADLHNDVLYENDSFDAGDNKVVCAVWTTELTHPLEFFTKVKHKAKFRAIEDAWFIKKENFDSIIDFAPVYCSLTWNHENNLAGGASHNDVGLKVHGKDIIDLLMANSISLDTAHLNERSFFDAIEYLDKGGHKGKDYSLICSHTCFNGVFRHKRNLTDGQIEAIIEFNGLVGLTLVGDFMGEGRMSEDAVIKQIEYFVGKFGAGHLGIGSDFFGSDSLVIKDYEELERFKNRLVKIGLKETDINAIFYENVNRFLKTRKER